MSVCFLVCIHCISYKYVLISMFGRHMLRATDLFLIANKMIQDQT